MLGDTSRPPAKGLRSSAHPWGLSVVIPAKAGIQKDTRGGFHVKNGRADQEAAKLAMAAWPREIPPSLHGTSL